jgi:ketosteroid isomerase-like protein
MLKTMTNDEDAICDLLDDFTRALYDEDAAGAIAPLADDAVAFDLAPPLKPRRDALSRSTASETIGLFQVANHSSNLTIVVDKNLAYPTDCSA